MQARAFFLKISLVWVNLSIREGKTAAAASAGAVAAKAASAGSAVWTLLTRRSLRTVLTRSKLSSSSLCSNSEQARYPRDPGEHVLVTAKATLRRTHSPLKRRASLSQL